MSILLGDQISIQRPVRDGFGEVGRPDQHEADQRALINLLCFLQSFWLHQDEKRLWLFWTYLPTFRDFL